MKIYQVDAFTERPLQVTPPEFVYVRHKKMTSGCKMSPVR